MLKRKKGSWTQVALVTVLACLCLGGIYGFLEGGLCWGCWKSDASEFQQWFEPWDARPACWYCDRCGRLWEAGTPWRKMNWRGKMNILIPGGPDQTWVNSRTGYTHLDLEYRVTLQRSTDIKRSSATIAAKRQSKLDSEK